MLTLAEANINGINLNYTEIDSTDGNGNAHSQTGTITKTDGTETTVTDVWFQAA